MSEFNNVTVVKAANIYFDGNVTSRTIYFSDGTHKTLGIMLPGNYTFSTGAKEIVEVISGSMQIRLEGEKEWTNYPAGTEFEVPAKSSFDLRISEVADYCCSYLD